MGLNVKVGTITQPGATGSVAYDLVPNFDLKAIILFTVGRAADGASASTDVADLSFGVGTYRGGTPQQWYSSHGAESGDQAAAHYASGCNTTDILKLYGPDMDVTPPNIDLEVALVSFGLQGGSSLLDRFTLDWQNLYTTASIIVGYIALGGSDITDALASTLAGSGATPQDVTVVAGFGQPDLLLTGPAVGSFVDAGATSSGADPKPTIGAGVSDSEQRVSLLKADDAAAAVVLGSYQADSLIASGNTTVTALDGEADLAAKANWPTDGFELAWATVSANNVPYLALKGTFSKKVGVYTNPTSGGLPVVQDIALGFPGKLALCFGNVLPATAAFDQTHADLGSWHFGASDGTTEWNMSWSDDDTNTVQRTRTQMDRDKAVAMWVNAAGAYTVLAEADVSFSGNNLRQSYPDIDATSREQVYVVLGDAPAAAPSGSSSVRGGGTLAATGSKGASRVSTARGGGTLAATARKGGTGTSTARGGGAVTSVGQKDTIAKTGISSIRGGGAVTSAVAKSASRTSSVRGGGNLSATDRKGGAGASTVRGGGTVGTAGQEGAQRPGFVSGGGGITSTGGKQARGSSAMRGGGSITTVGSALEAHTGTSSVRGGGSVTSSGRHGGQRVSDVRSGGRLTASAAHGATRASSATGGGRLFASFATGHTGTSTIRGGGQTFATATTARASASSVRGGGFVTSTGAALAPADPAVTTRTGRGGPTGRTRTAPDSGRTLSDVQSGRTRRGEG